MGYYVRKYKVYQEISQDGKMRLISYFIGQVSGPLTQNSETFFALITNKINHRKEKIIDYPNNKQFFILLPYDGGRKLKRMGDKYGFSNQPLERAVSPNNSLIIGTFNNNGRLVKRWSIFK